MSTSSFAVQFSPSPFSHLWCHLSHVDDDFFPDFTIFHHLSNKVRAFYTNTGRVHFVAGRGRHLRRENMNASKNKIFEIQFNLDFVRQQQLLLVFEFDYFKLISKMLYDLMNWRWKWLLQIWLLIQQNFEDDMI